MTVLAILVGRTVLAILVANMPGQLLKAAQRPACNKHRLKTDADAPSQLATGGVTRKRRRTKSGADNVKNEAKLRKGVLDGVHDYATRYRNIYWDGDLHAFAYTEGGVVVISHPKLRSIVGPLNVLSMARLESTEKHGK